jgi:hypothetical protein
MNPLTSLLVQPPTNAEEDLEAAACLLTLPGLGGIKITATKKSAHNMESPASKGPLIGKDGRDAVEDAGEEVEESEEALVVYDDVHPVKYE